MLAMRQVGIKFIRTPKKRDYTVKSIKLSPDQYVEVPAGHRLVVTIEAKAPHRRPRRS